MRKTSLERFDETKFIRCHTELWSCVLMGLRLYCHVVLNPYRLRNILLEKF